MTIPRAEERIIVGLPPEDSFAGHAYDIGVLCVDTLRRIGANVLAISAEEWDDPELRPNVLARARRFSPEFALAIPQTGYALRFKDGDGKNLFTDLLGVRLALPWDHLLTQAPTYFLRDMRSAPQRPGALETMRRGLTHPLNRHYSPDSGHVEVYEEFGLLARGTTPNWVPSGVREFVEAGLKEASPDVRGRVGFAGNVYTAQGAKLKLLQHAFVRQLDAALLDAKRRRWDVAGWYLMRELLDRYPQEFREQNGLTPDYPLFWWMALDLLSYRVNTDFRLCVLESIDSPVDFWGNFVDPDSTVGSSATVQFCGSVPYDALPELFRRYELWVDVTNAPFINGCGAKVYHCFAAGSFMLMDYHKDVRTEVGELADRFMYRSAEELREKITYYFAHPKERSEIIDAMQTIVRERLTLEHFYARICREMREETTAGVRA